MIRITGFDWDDGNRQKCQKHGLSLEEIEIFFRQKDSFIAFDSKHSHLEQRFIAMGRMPHGKPVAVAFTMRGGYARPISARYMHEKEVRRYKKTHSFFQDG